MAGLRRQLRIIGRRLEAEGLVHGSSGNLSARLGDAIWISAAGARLGALRRTDLVRRSTVADGGRGQASSEWALHAAIYRARPEINAIVHTHSPYATAWSCSATPLALTLEEARYYGMGDLVPAAPHAPAGSLSLARLTVERLADGAAVLLQRHGAVTVGQGPWEAFAVARSLEHQAHVAWIESVLVRRPSGLAQTPRFRPPSTSPAESRTMMHAKGWPLGGVRSHPDDVAGVRASADEPF